MELEQLVVDEGEQVEEEVKWVCATGEMELEQLVVDEGE